MENNKKSFLGKIFSGKNDGDVKPAGKKCLPCGAINAPDAKFCFACGSAFPVIYDSFDAFISYRRETASDLASLLKVQLENNFHKNIFIDIKELQVGRFDEALLRRIEDTPNFILILSKSSLDRCQEKSDWLKREIVHALQTGRNIIPIMMKGFEFPTEHTWELLPPEMRVLSSLNGINYDHIHQDSVIRMVASYMKSAKEVPPAKFVPVPEEPETPPPTKPPTKPVSPKPQPVKPDTAGATYFPVTGILVVDSDGSETLLTEFGVRIDSYLQLDSASRDDLSVSIGKGIKSIPWGQIESVDIKGSDDCTIKMIDGTSIEHVKLIPSRLVGKTENDILFAFEFKNALTITTSRDSTLRGRDELIRYIPILAKRANPQANRWTLTIRPEGEGVSVTAENFYYSELKNAHTFRLPGPHKFSANESFLSFSVSPIVGENFTIGPFPKETALALALALNRLNSLLSEDNDPAKEKDTSGRINPESIVILKRGEYLTVGTRDSKVRSVYYGPGTVLKCVEKGKGAIYQWYRFQGADGNDFWFEGPGPIDTVDRRCFFRIDETGQVGYMVELLGERTDPWGSLEEFKIDDDTVGPTVVRFDQIVSMTSKNGEITVQKDSGFLSGTLQKLANYNAGSWTKGPCLVTSDAVIPLARTNRVSSMTVTRINGSEKPPLIPALIYSDKTQLKFTSQTNSNVGHFDGITPDMYIQLDEKELGRMRISIPQIVRISVDPASVEAPVTVQTTAGRVFEGKCLDPFNFSGSVMLFDNVKKPLILISTIHGSPDVAEQGRRNLSGPDQVTADPTVVGNVNDQSWFMKTTEGPGQRSDFGMVYDDKQEVIILHGGFGPGNADSRSSGVPAWSPTSPEQNDTWTWDGSSWRLLSNATLSLVNHAMAFNKKTKQNVITGGWTGSQRLNDTHILTGDKWIKAENGIEFYKGGFSNHAMAYDEKRKTIILFGGMTIMFPGGQIALGDTWEWDGQAWSRLFVNGPEPRWGHKMVYDMSTGTILLFGGYDGKKYFDDTWIWNGNTAEWSKVTPGTVPGARCHHGLTCDTVRGRVLMFGGLPASETPLNDLWEWNGTNWTLLMAQAPPKPRYNHGFVYDPGRNKSLLFGGFDGKEFFRDSWELTF